MPRLRKRWPRQRRAFRFIVPAGHRGRGPGSADPAGRPRRGNQHSPPGRRGPRRPRGRLSVRPSARSAPEPRRERGSHRAGGGREERARRGATPGCARAAGASVGNAGSAGALQPPAPAPPSVLSPVPPRPPPRSARPAPPRPRDRAACSQRSLAPCPPRSRGAPSRLPDAEPKWGTVGVRSSPNPVANSQVAGRECAQRLPSGCGNRGSAESPRCLACPHVPPPRRANRAGGCWVAPGTPFPGLPNPSLREGRPLPQGCWQTRD